MTGRRVQLWVDANSAEADTPDVDLGIIHAEHGDSRHSLLRAVWADFEEHFAEGHHPQELAVVRPGKRRRRGTPGGQSDQ